MVPKLLQIIVMVSFAMSMVRAEISNGQQKSNMSLGKDHIISPQNLKSIRFDQSKPIFIQLESVPALEDVIENKLKKLESILLQRLDYIARNLSSLVNKTCDTVRAEPIDVNSTQQIPVTNQSSEINWSECKKEENTIIGTMTNFSSLLHGFDSGELRHVFWQTAGGRTTFVHMRFGLQAVSFARIVLSPVRDPEPTKYFYFTIDIDSEGVSLWKSTETVSYLSAPSSTTLLSGSQPVTFLLTLYEGRLELRWEPSAAPFLEHHDERFGDIKYFGIVDLYRDNSGRNATLYYDCQNDILAT